MQDEAIILLDYDMNYQVMGILRVPGHTKEEIYNVFDDIKAEFEGYWTLGDLLNGIKDKGWLFNWDTNFSTMTI